MTIGFLINTCEPFYRGGYERRAWAFARELVRQGHEVRIYTSCPRDEMIDGIHFIRLGPLRPFFNAHGVRNGWADLFFALNIMRLLGKLRRRELDVLDICATPFLHLPLAALVCRIKRIPAVLTCHEALLASLPAYVRERGYRNHLAGTMIRLLLEGLYRFGTGLLTCRLAVSHRTAASLAREDYPARGVVEFGLEDAASHSHAPEAKSESEPVRFIFCGRLTPIKNVEATVRALLSLRAEEESFHFDIIGEGSERIGLERRIQEAGAEAWFTFHGEVPEKRKREILSAGEVFVLSSPREGFSIATLEAMALGCCAVVVSDPRQPNGALDFVHADEQGLCVSPGMEPLREGLQLLMRDPVRRLAFRRAAWIMAQNYRIEGQARRLLEFYQETQSSS